MGVRVVRFECTFVRNKKDLRRHKLELCCLRALLLTDCLYCAAEHIGQEGPRAVQRFTQGPKGGVYINVQYCKQPQTYRLLVYID